MTEPDSQSTHESSDSEKSPLLRRIADFLFGYDFFISYSWSDGRRYAAALQEALEEQGFTCFLDSDDYAKGDNWRTAGRRALKKTSRLLLVATPGALKSEPVATELRVFSGLRRRIVPIDLEGTLLSKPNLGDLEQYLDPNILHIGELSEGAIEKGPSEEVLHEIRASFNLERQDQKRVRWFAGAAVAFGLIAVAAVVLFFLAEHRRKAADVATLEARSNLTKVDFSGARNSLQTGRVNEAVSSLWNARSHAPDADRRESADRLLRSWLSDAGRTVQHSGEGGEAVLAPGGHRVVVFDSSGSNAPYLINTQTGETVARLREIETPDWRTPFFEFSTDGRLLGYRKKDHSAVILDTTTGEVRHAISVPGGVHRIMPLDDERYFLCQAQRPGITLVDALSQTEMAVFRFDQSSPEDQVEQLLRSGDGRRLFAVQGDRGRLAAWDLTTGEAFLQTSNLDFIGDTNLFSTNRDGSLLAGINSFGVPSVNLTETGETVWSPQSSRDMHVTTDVIAFHPEFPEIGAVGWGDTVEVKRLDGGRFPAAGFFRHQESVRLVCDGDIIEVAFSADGESLVAVTDTGSCQIFGLVERTPGSLESMATGVGGAYIYSRDLVHCITRKNDRRLLLNATDASPLGPEIAFLPVNGSDMRLMAVSPDGTLAVVAGALYAEPENRLYVAVFETDTSKLAHPELIFVENIPESLFFGLDSQHVMAVMTSPDNPPELHAWNASTGELTGNWELHSDRSRMAIVELGPSCKQIAVAVGSLVQLWQIEDAGLSGTPVSITLADGAEVQRIAFAESGNRLAIAAVGAVTLWDQNGAAVSGPIRVDRHDPAIAFSEDGEKIALSEGEIARVYEVSSGRPLTDPLRHLIAVSGLSFSSDGTMLVASCSMTDEGISYTDVQAWDARVGIALGPKFRYDPLHRVVFKKGTFQIQRFTRFGTAPADLHADFSAVSDDTNRLRLTAEIITGKFLGDGSERLQMPPPAIALRLQELENLGGPVVQIPRLIAVSPLSRSKNPKLEIPKDTISTFLANWVAAQNSAASSLSNFYTDNPRIDGEILSIEKLEADQAEFEEMFPERAFTYLDHEVMSENADVSTTVSVKQHVLLVDRDGFERELEIQDYLKLDKREAGLRIQSRKRIDTLMVRDTRATSAID